MRVEGDACCSVRHDVVFPVMVRPTWFRGEGLGFRIQGLGLRFRIEGVGCRTKGLKDRVQGVGLSV